MAPAAIGGRGHTFFFDHLMTLTAETMAGLFIIIERLIIHLLIVTGITFLGCHFLSVDMMAFHAYIHFLVHPVGEFSNLPCCCRFHRNDFRPDIGVIAFGNTLAKSADQKHQEQTTDTYVLQPPDERAPP